MGKRVEGGRGRIWKGGEGREGTGEGRRERVEKWGGGEGRGGEGRGVRHGLRPLETSSGSAPGFHQLDEVAVPNYAALPGLVSLQSRCPHGIVG